MRDDRCPLCGSRADSVLQLHFNTKLKLPTDPFVRHCALDNFLFIASGAQNDYDEYYKSVANDTCHSEMSGGAPRSIISKVQMDHLLRALTGFFDQPKNVLDFGCGEACLLVELADRFPASTFSGYDPGPASTIGKTKATTLGLDNLKILDLKTCTDQGPYDLVVTSHIVEHLLDFDLFRQLRDLVTGNGLLYVEVPNSIEYAAFPRQEFLYYFDRLHVNHFTPQSLARLATAHGFGYIGQFEYSFPYRDGGKYPALGMLFKKDARAVEVSSPSILEAAKLYIAQERARANVVASELAEYESVLVWGAGDNFYRSIDNGGPLSALRSMHILDRRQQKIEAGGSIYVTEEPLETIRKEPWPVIVTISEGRNSICAEICQIDPARRILTL